MKLRRNALSGNEIKIEALLRRMTIREKVGLLSGQDGWCSKPIKRLGIGYIIVTDGPHGVRSVSVADGLWGARLPGGPTTAFPTGTALAATWNPALIEKVGQVIADETRGVKCDVTLGPCVNIVRTPLAGRNFETYSEDPYLAGRMGVAWVKGVQSRGISACLKHFACNNQEFERMRGNSIVDERTLREIYLPQFETIVKETRPWAVMCAYNRVNGAYASENGRLMNDILRKEWGFDGVVVSDWGAVHAITGCANGGLDLEMPGPGKYMGPLLIEAVANWQVEEEVIDAAVRRMLRWLWRCGKIGSRPSRFCGAINTPEHQKLARTVAEEAMTLLKNDAGALPLDLRKLKSIAVIGPTAQGLPISGAGSSFVRPPYRVSPLEALKKRLGRKIRIDYAQGCDNVTEPPMMTGATLQPTKKRGIGLKAEFFDNPNFSGKPVGKRIDQKYDFWLDNKAPMEGMDHKQFSIRWTGVICVPETGRYQFRIHALGEMRLFIDGRLVLRYCTAPAHRREPIPHYADGFVNLTGGKEHKVRMEYSKFPDEEVAFLTMRFGKDPLASEEKNIKGAAALAKSSNAALVFVGFQEGWESEGFDRPHMELTRRQNELVSRVARANPNTTVVLSCGAPVAMPWLDDVQAVLLTHYAGMEGGSAVVRALAGDVNPSGKLPVTFPRRYKDNPTYRHYPGQRDVRYGEGIFVGYRHYDRRGVKPLFPFGFGLSYTTFEYSRLKAPARVRMGNAIPVSVTVTNTGRCSGKEVVQLYVADKIASVPRPPKELKGFEKVSLAPGESRTVRFVLNERDLSFYDTKRKRWVAEPGEFRILVGGASRDIRQEAVVRVGP